MAVPNNTTFSLQDVCDSVAGAQDDLAECFAEANASNFNGSYSGSKNSLLNFRDYDESSAETLSISPTNYTETSGNGGSFTLTITSNTAWTISDNATWVTIGSPSGSGNASRTVSIGTNLGSFRSATITVTTGDVTRTCSVAQPPSNA